MAGTFQPKFVDLVRSSISNSGNGNFAVGPAPAGFTGFGAVLSTGDRFYYCAVNGDKPAEREVGRGTMMADGSIAREPIQGAAVNFTGGAKTLSLVTAAEWFTDMAAGSGGIASAATRTAVASTANASGLCALRERGREGLFAFDSANLSAQVAADSRQAMYIAPAGQTGSGGAWVRCVDGPVNVRWFGATGDGTTNDSGAFVAALALLHAIAGNEVTARFKSGPKLFVPAGHYFMGTTTLDINHTLIIEGEGTGQAGVSYASRLRWAAGATGIRIQRFNTSGIATTDATEHHGGDGLVLRGLQLSGGYAGTEGEFHGIYAKSRFAAEDVRIDYWQGDGIYSIATAGGGAAEGNANMASVRRCSIHMCRDGLFIDGADTNVWDVQALDVSSNRRWGINDSSFLGNNYHSCHSDSNGTVTGTTPTMVSHGGNYFAVRDGQAAGASTNPPPGSATSNAYWLYIGAGGPNSFRNIPAWTSGIAVRAGGAYRTDNLNAANLFTGCYSEEGQGPSQMVPPTLVVGGLHGARVVGVPRLYSRADGTLASSGGLSADGNLAITGELCRFGPETGPATDNYFFMNSTNYYNFLSFKSWNAGVPQTDAELQSGRGSGLILKGYPAVQLRHGPSGATVLDMTGSGVAVTGTLSASGNLSAANLSGSNSGDQMIALTGDVTGSGGGSFAATIAANAVTFAKMQDLGAASRLVGRGSAGGAGDPQEITLGSRLAMSGTVLNALSDWSEVTLGSDFTCANSTTFNDITDGTSPLTYTPPANSAFEVQAVLLLQTTTATNLPRVQVNVAAQGSGAYGCVQIDQTGATATARVTADGSFTTSAVTVTTAAGDLPAANTPYMCFVTVRGKSGASPGVIKLQAACETAAANACLIKAGSHLRAKAG